MASQAFSQEQGAPSCYQGGGWSCQDTHFWDCNDCWDGDGTACFAPRVRGYTKCRQRAIKYQGVTVSRECFTWGSSCDPNTYEEPDKPGGGGGASGPGEPAGGCQCEGFTVPCEMYCPE